MTRTNINNCSSMSEKSTKVPCAGIIVFDNDLTVVVSTERGNYSFPKGKRKKTETNLEAAWRELTEETGLTTEHVVLIGENYLDELSEKGYVCVRYYVGHLIKSLDKLVCDPSELTDVKWMNVNDVLQLDKIKDTRKHILRLAYQMHQGKYSG